MKFLATVALAALFYCSSALRFSENLHQQSGTVNKPSNQDATSKAVTVDAKAKT